MRPSKLRFPLSTATATKLFSLMAVPMGSRSEEHTSELQSPCNLVCRLLLEKKKKNISRHVIKKNNQVEQRIYNQYNIKNIVHKCIRLEAMRCLRIHKELSNIIDWMSRSHTH